MDRLRSMQVFRHVVELKSFTAAATRLRLSPAMASKHVMHLERHLGTRLLNRTSRHVTLTEDGRVYFEQCRQMLDSLDEVEALLARSTVEPKGVLRLTAPVWAASEPFARALASFRERHPQVSFEVDLSGRLVNLVEEGFDLALRVSDTPGDTLIAQTVGSVTFQLVAAPAYLARAGRPTSLQALADHDILWYSLGPSDLSKHGVDPIKLKPVLSSDNETLLHQAALRGMGLAALPTWLVADDLRSGRLERLLPTRFMLRTEIYGVYPSRRQLSSKTRAFLDFLRTDAHLFE